MQRVNKLIKENDFIVFGILLLFFGYNANKNFDRLGMAYDKSDWIFFSLAMFLFLVMSIFAIAFGYSFYKLIKKNKSTNS